MRSFVGNQDSFKTRSKRLTGAYIPTKTRTCRKHLFSYWGDGYPRCVKGYRKNEECEELKV